MEHYTNKGFCFIFHLRHRLQIAQKIFFRQQTICFIFAFTVYFRITNPVKSGDLRDFVEFQALCIALTHFLCTVLWLTQANTYVVSHISKTTHRNITKKKLTGSNEMKINLAKSQIFLISSDEEFRALSLSQLPIWLFFNS